MLRAYNGVILDIDLTNERIEEKKLDESVAKLFVGGKGLGNQRNQISCLTIPSR